MANEYLTSDEAATHLGINASSESNGSLGEVVDAVSRQIDGHCQRHFWQDDTTRSFTAEHATVLTLGPFNDLISATEVEENGSAVSYRLEPRNTAGPETRPFSSIRRTDGNWDTSTDSEITVTGVFGWPEVPAAVKQACRIQVARVFKRIDSPLGVAGFGDMGVVRMVPFDHDVRQLLAPYVIYAGFA